MSDYPEHDKLEAVKVESQAIGEFLDFGPYVLCEPDPNQEGRYRACHKSIGRILADWFGVDADELEREKRRMLEVLRAEAASR